MMDPRCETTAVLDEFRTAQISHLLVAAVTEFDVGAALADKPLSFAALREQLGLQERPSIVLLTALRSIDLLDVVDGMVCLTEYGRRKLAPHSPEHLRGYIGLGAFSADVRTMIQCLRDDRPAGDVSFVYHEGVESALDDERTADALTRAMADRARNVAPRLANQLKVGTAEHLVDVGGGHGLYSLELLKANAALRATIIDRAPALRVAKEYAAQAGLTGRVTLLCDDAHRTNQFDPPDLVLLANLLHDYNKTDASRLVAHYSDCLSAGGRLVVLDSFLNSVAPGAPPISTGPRPVAAYSALLFSICEGRCYRPDEVADWMESAGLVVSEEVLTVPAHGSVLTGVRD